MQSATLTVYNTVFCSRFKFGAVTVFIYINLHDSFVHIDVHKSVLTTVCPLYTGWSCYMNTRCPNNA